MWHDLYLWEIFDHIFYPALKQKQQKYCYFSLANVYLYFNSNNSKSRSQMLILYFALKNKVVFSITLPEIQFQNFNAFLST
jgi:hypothetical protein